MVCIISKGIILAGGHATRLKPITNVISKHLMPIYNKPMIYYPLSNLIQAGIRDYLIITNPEYLSLYKKLLGDGKKLGLRIRYKIQSKPLGLPHAFILGEKFINNEPVCLNLGDHIFFGDQVSRLIKKNIQNFLKTTIFVFKHKNPKDYGVINFDKNFRPLKIVEKPIVTKSKYIICGLYIYDSNVVEYTKKLKFSKRKELEISDLNNLYLKKKMLSIEKININNCWIDAGTPEKISLASNKICNMESKRKYIGMIEWESYKQGFISQSQYEKFIDVYKNNYYSEMLKSKLQ